MSDDFNIDDLRRSNTNRTPPEFSDAPAVVIPVVPQSGFSVPVNGRGCITFFLLIFTAVVFFFCGRGCTPAELPHREPAPVVTVTKTVTVTKEVSSVPKDCTDALDTAAKMLPLMNTINTQNSQVVDIISRARISIVEEDHQGLIRAGNDLHAALSKATPATGQFMDLQNVYNSQVKACNTALGR